MSPKIRPNDTVVGNTVCPCGDEFVQWEDNKAFDSSSLTHSLTPQTTSCMSAVILYQQVLVSPKPNSLGVQYSYGVRMDNGYRITANETKASNMQVWLALVSDG